MTPNAAFEAVMPGRGAMVSFFRPDQVLLAEQHCAFVAYDNGMFSMWMAAMKAGLEWADVPDMTPYYRWLEPRLFHPGRWAVIPDSPGAPTQINDGLLNDWPFGRSRGVPLWHMDGPIERLARLCERYDRVALGWIGHPKKEPVGCADYRRKMDEVAALMGNNWHPLHMMRGVKVAHDYPFASADSTSLAQNGHRYDWRDKCVTAELVPCPRGGHTIRGEGPRKWKGRTGYADRLERGDKWQLMSDGAEILSLLG